MDEKLIEAVARAMCDENEWANPWDAVPEDTREFKRKEARAAIEAVRAYDEAKAKWWADVCDQASNFS